jgi:uncharacterized protein
MAYALVTGSAKGIGKSIAIELAKKGYDLLLTDLDEANLVETTNEIKAAHHRAVSYIVKDLGEADVAQTLLLWSEPFHDDLEIVVNNAGYGLTGYFEKLPIKEQLGIVDVNIKATVAITYAFLPILHQRPKAHVMITGSTTSYQSVPYLTIYAASKAFILSFTRSLRYELRKSNINVSCLVPGPTDTHWVKRAGIGKHTLKTADIFNMTPDEVGRIGVHGMFKNRSEIITGITNKLNAFFPKFFPKRFVESIGGGIYDPEKNAKQLK